MTLKELEKEVLALCHESVLEDRNAFIAAVRRALAEIYTERDRCELFHEYVPEENGSVGLRRIDVAKKDGRFLAPRTPPLGSDGEPISGAFTHGSEIFLPHGFSGDVLLEYKRLPEPLSFSATDATLDVSRECEHLVATLVAAYLLLDGNEALADYYMGLYREGMAAVKVYNRQRTGTKYTDTTGWA